MDVKEHAITRNSLNGFRNVPILFDSEHNFGYIVSRDGIPIYNVVVFDSVESLLTRVTEAKSCPGQTIICSRTFQKFDATLYKALISHNVAFITNANLELIFKSCLL